MICLCKNSIHVILASDCDGCFIYECLCLGISVWENHEAYIPKQVFTDNEYINLIIRSLLTTLVCLKKKQF